MARLRHTLQYIHTREIVFSSLHVHEGIHVQTAIFRPCSMRYTNLYNSIATNAERMEVQSSKYIYSVISSNQDIDVALGTRGRG